MTPSPTVDRSSPAGATPEGAAAAIAIRGVEHTYAAESGTVSALSAVDLTIEAGQFVSIVGPSGCGKTTLLRAVAGLLEPSGGRIEVFGASPRLARRDRALGLVTQDPGLLPWRSVQANVQLAIDLAGSSAASPAAGAAHGWLERVGIDRYAGLYPGELSGGMKQRVALARALAVGPRLLLMDEPFGALDELSREAMRLELLALWERERMSVLFVTHSIREALLLSDRVVVMSGSPGRILEDVAVALPRPRSDALLSAPAFLEAEQHIRALLRAGA
ncbi:MAG: ABC transporter ATP-binding protein [Chloroflexi bacterium]|nr:ABC transporter ATP-binding protein [Chloroflexota bacterium]MDA1145516.1 ABC transporter ATP-binding protein [Chloroflexota bacterium]